MYDLVVDGQWRRGVRVGQKLKHPDGRVAIIGPASTAEYLLENWDLWPRVSDPVPNDDPELFNKPILTRTVDSDNKVVTYTYTSSPKSAEEVANGKKAKFDAAIEAHLDAEAKSQGFNDMMSACRYAPSTSARGGKGKAALAGTEAIWDYANKALTDVLAGDRAEPTIEELIAELPVIVW